MCTLSLLCIFSLRLPFLSRRMCVREPMCASVCVFANERVQALFFFWTSLWCCCLFIYFSACKGLFSAVRATADWARVALSAIHQRGASLTDEPVTSAPYSTSAWSRSYAGRFLFLRRRSVTRRASASSPPCLYRCASHVKQLFHLWPWNVVLLWFLSDNGPPFCTLYSWFDTFCPLCSQRMRNTKLYNLNYHWKNSSSHVSKRLNSLINKSKEEVCVHKNAKAEACLRGFFL